MALHLVKRDGYHAVATRHSCFRRMGGRLRNVACLPGWDADLSQGITGGESPPKHNVLPRVSAREVDPPLALVQASTTPDNSLSFSPPPPPRPGPPFQEGPFIVLFGWGRGQGRFPIGRLLSWESNAPAFFAYL